MKQCRECGTLSPDDTDFAISVELRYRQDLCAN